MAEATEERGAEVRDLAPPQRKGAAAEAPPSAVDPARRVRFEALGPEHMPTDYSISLDAYRRGGTDRFIGKAPEGLVSQPMRGFEPQYVNIIDYIVRITHRIWEEKDIGYIYDTYSHDCTVWDDLGLQYGRDKIVADTVHTNNAFPDIRLVADEVVWAGNEIVGFHTSHRTKILGTNTGYSRYGAPTGKRIQLWCMANCVARDNEIFHEHVLYDTAGLVQQLGFGIAIRRGEQRAVCSGKCRIVKIEAAGVQQRAKDRVDQLRTLLDGVEAVGVRVVACGVKQVCYLRAPVAEDTFDRRAGHKKIPARIPDDSAVNGAAAPARSEMECRQE